MGMFSMRGNFYFITLIIMWYAVYEVWDRYWWYGVPAICEHPDCNEEIDRWMSYACWWEPFSEFWCDRYFCSKHLSNEYFDEDWFVLSDHAPDEAYDSAKCVDICEKCKRNEEPFPYKPEHKKWIKHLLKDPSWKEWRDNNPEKVEEFKNKKSLAI